VLRIYIPISFDKADSVQKGNGAHLSQERVTLAIVTIFPIVESPC